MSDERGAHARVDDVLADLGGQLDAAEAAELAAEVEDRTRRETALLSAVDRLRASIGVPVAVTTAQEDVTGVLSEVGPDWLLLRRSPAQTALIPLRAVVAVSGLGPAAVASSSAGAVADRLDLRYVLREVVRDRSPVRLVVSGGRTLTGLLNRCGVDFVEMSPAPAAAGSGTEAGGSANRLVTLRAIVTLHLG